MIIQFSTKKITLWLSIVLVILHSVSTAGRVIEYLLGHEDTTGLVRLFHAAEEGNIPTWFSSFLLLFSAVLLALIAKERFIQKDSYARHWVGLSIIFLYLSLEEASRLHDVVSIALRAALNLEGFFYSGWKIIVILLLLVLMGFYYKFLWELPRDTKILFILSGTLYIWSALGMETAGWFLWGKDAANWGIINGILVTLEELFENVAIVIFIYSLLKYIKTYFVVEEISFEVT
jgi:hypothetical protein